MESLDVNWIETFRYLGFNQSIPGKFWVFLLNEAQYIHSHASQLFNNNHRTNMQLAGKNPLLALPMVRFPHSSHCKSLQKDFGKFKLESPIRDCCLPKAAFLCVEISAKMAQQDSRMCLRNGILLYPLYRSVCHLSLRSPRALQLLPGKCPFPQQPTDIWLS